MSDPLSRALLALALVLVSVVLATVGVGFVCAAFYLGLAALTGRPLAAALTAIVLVAMAAVLALLARAIARSPSSRRAGSADVATRETLGREVGRLVGEEMSEMVRSHALGATGIALAAGFVAGLSPQLRRRLLRLLQ